MPNQSLPKGLEQLGYGPSFQSTLTGMLEDVPMFRDLDGHEIELLSHFVGAYAAGPGVTIYTEGGRNNFLCLLVSGTLEVIKEQSEKERRRLAVIRPGKPVGEMAFLDKQPHSAHVLTTTPCTFLMLTEHGFERLSEEYPRLALKLALKLAQLLSHRLRQTSGQLVDYLK